MDRCPAYCRHLLPGAFRPEQDAAVDGFAGLDGFGSKLKKAVKKVAKPVQKVITAPVKAVQTIAPKELRRPMEKAMRGVRSISAKGGMVRTLAKNKWVQRAGAIAAPTMVMPALADKDFRRNTMPIYAAYGAVGAAALTGGAAAGALAAGTAATQQGAQWFAQEQMPDVSTMPTPDTGGMFGEPVPAPAEAPTAAPEEDAAPSSPLAPLGIAAAALAALAFFR